MRVFVSAKEGEPDGNGGRWPDAIEVVIPARELITDWANWAVIETETKTTSRPRPATRRRFQRGACAFFFAEGRRAV